MSPSVCLALLLCTVGTAYAKQPHILLILADDYGWHDVGYHDSEIRTPTLDKLAAEGVKLENYYVQPICSPSRSQLMSGRYQIHTGLQHGVIRPYQANGLPLQDKTIADQLRAVGYATHMVGKWHLGFYKKEYTPTYRGFDSFFGYLTGAEDYFTHIRCWTGPGWKPPDDACGTDLHHNEEVIFNNTEYSTMLFTKKVISIVENHHKNKPLFLYLPFQAVHGPMEVPKYYSDMYKNITNKKRRIYAGMVTCMDEAIRNITDAYKAAGLWDDTVLIFSTDNGGQPHHGGSNYPLRGNKGTLWEGGVHGVGFVHSDQINKKGSVNDEMIHISDWYPTMLHLARSNASTDHLDGYNQWDTISNNLLSPRKEILHNIDPDTAKKGDKLFPDTFDTRVRAAIRVGDWKLLTGNVGDGSWTPAPNATVPDISKDTQNLWLFNIKEDPNEHNDLSKQYPDQVKLLLDRLAAYNATAVPCRYPAADPQCDPHLNGGAWVPWEK